MKNTLLFFILCFFISEYSFSQKQANYWYFGNKTGLNFNQTPVQVLTDSKISSIEGSASISDNNGSLLFYTNGEVVINREHQVMANGNNLLGDLSSTNNTVIVPVYGADSLYYLFTIGAAGQSLKGFRYSVINMKRQNGLGEVIIKNVLVDDDSYEKLAAVRHCNKKDVWITIKKWDSDQYYTYLLSSAGLNNIPVISSTGLVVTGTNFNSLGVLKFSPSGHRLAAVHSFENDLVELMEFNNATGLLSNPVRFKPNIVTSSSSFPGIYGTEFSPDGRLLYVSANNNGSGEASVLYQFDISSMSISGISASRQIISQNNSWFAGALQAGPDGKIYFAMWKNTALSVIENPNVYGAGCNFTYNSLFLSSIGDPVQFGLPNFISSDLYSQYLPYDFIRSGSCTSQVVGFQLNRTDGIDSVLWNFGDGQQSILQNPTHTYDIGGIYSVSLTIYKNDCGAPSETVTHQIAVALNTQNFLPDDTTFCSPQTLTLTSLTNANQYLWSTGQTSSSIDIINPGLYWLQIVKDGCNFRDSFQLSLNNSQLVVDLGRDISVCVDKPVTLDAGPLAVKYLWSNGDTTRTTNVWAPGTYWVDIEGSGGCHFSDTLKAVWGDCGIFIPSAFSPNGDGVNETFGLINGITSPVFKMNIYNRYGQVIFTTADSFKRWDGKFKGKPVPVGAYPWMMTYKNKDGFIQTDKGVVLLVR